jgi:hypothetical protein
MGKGKKLFVVEARRLLPLLFLLVLLVSLSLYDSFRASPAVNPGSAAGANDVTFTTADKGERKEAPTFRLAVDEEDWADVVSEWSITVPEYPFQPQHQVALFALHAEVQNVKTVPNADGGLNVEVRVNQKRDYFQVVTLPAVDVTLDDGEVTWTFADRRGNILEQFTVGESEKTMAEEAPRK